MQSVTPEVTHDSPERVTQDDPSLNDGLFLGSVAVAATLGAGAYVAELVDSSSAAGEILGGTGLAVFALAFVRLAVLNRRRNQ